MPYKRKKGGQRLMELSEKGGRRRRAKAKAAKSAKAAAVNRANRLISGASPKTSKLKTIRHGKTKITVNGKPSPQLTSSRPTPKPTPKPPATKPTKTPDKKKNFSRVVTEAEKKQFSKLLKKKQAERREPKGAYAKLLKADRDKGFAPGAGGAKGGGTISAASPKSAVTKLLDKLAPKHRGIGQSQTGYSRAGAGDVGLEVGKKALDAWMTVGAGKALKGIPGLWKKMQPWRTGGKPIMSKEFIKTLGGKNLKSFTEFVKREKTFKQAFPRKAHPLTKSEKARRVSKAKATRAKTEADRVEAVAKNKATKVKADSPPKTPAKKTPAKKTPAKKKVAKAPTNKATKPINKPYKTPAKHPLKSWKAPATKKAAKKSAAARNRRRKS